LFHGDPHAGITGDFNPAHFDQAYAEKTGFKTRNAHGMMTAGFISNLLVTQLPGPGSIYMQQILISRPQWSSAIPSRPRWKLLKS